MISNYNFIHCTHVNCNKNFSLGQFYGERAIQFIKAKLKEFNTGVTLIQSIEDCENDTLGTGCPGFLDGVLTFIGATGNYLQLIHFYILIKCLPNS